MGGEEGFDHISTLQEISQYEQFSHVQDIFTKDFENPLAGFEGYASEDPNEYYR